MSSPANNILLRRQAAKKPPATEERKERREVPHAFSVIKRPGTSRSLMLVLHRPYAAITAVIFVSLPGGPTDVQVRIRSSGEHHHGSRVPHFGGKTRRFSVKGPKNHPVRTDGNRGTCGVERGRVASLGGAVQHVDQARGGVRWLRLAGCAALHWRCDRSIRDLRIRYRRHRTPQVSVLYLPGRPNNDSDYVPMDSFCGGHGAGRC